MDYRLATVCVMVVLTPVNLNPFLESGQLIKTDSCICPEGIITYQCVIDGTNPGGFTIWNGTAFNCGQSNNILLRHNLFSTQTGAFGSCNNGIISGQSLGVSEGNVYTSQLQVNITNSSRLDLVGRTVQCVYSPDGNTHTVINSTTIMTTDPLPPPDDIQLTRVKPNELTFNWSSVQPDCSTLQYELQSNCGMCTNNPNMLTSAVCSFELSAIANGVCNFTVRSTVCGNIMGRLSSPVLVTLRVPASPTIQSVIPTYDIEGNLISVEANFTDVDSFNISNMVDGSALYYIMNFIDSSSVVCNSLNVSASSCSQRICMVSPLQLTGCSQTGNINVTVSAFNLLGEGPDSSISIASTNQYVEVRFESTNRIICTFRDQQNNQNKSCNLIYGPCQQNRNFSMTIQGTRVSLSSPSIVMIDLPTQLVTSGYCYVINANNGTFTTLIEGTFSLEGNGGQINVTGIIVGTVISFLAVLVIIVVTIIIFIVLKFGLVRIRVTKSRKSEDAEERRGLVDSEIDAPEYEKVKAHIVFNIRDRPEELVEALKLLSDTINIKNIKISPLSLEKEEPGMKICIECDHNLTREQKIQIEKLTKLGKIKVNLKATIEKVIKDEEESKHLETINEELQHEKGALCSLLQALQDTEECRHISITDIIHESVEGNEDCKLVTIKFLPQMPKNWRDKFDENKLKYEHILQKESETPNTSTSKL